MPNDRKPARWVRAALGLVALAVCAVATLATVASPARTVQAHEPPHCGFCWIPK